MSFHTYKIEKYSRKADGTYETTPVEFTGIKNVSVTIGIGNNADTFSFAISNTSGDSFLNTAINDRVIIYSSYDGITYNQLIDGIVEQKDVSRDVDDNSVVVSGMNRLEKLFNSLVQTTGENVAKTADSWIQLILDQINANNPDLQIGWASGNASLDSAYAVPFVRDYVQAFTLIDELSRPEYTDGKSYIYYLNSDNEFVWVPRPETTSATPAFGSEIKSIKVSKGIWDTVNAFVMYCGESPYGTSITHFDYDVLSVNKNGWKMKPVLAQRLAEDLQTIEWAKMVADAKYSEGSRFPSSYPYIMTDGTSVSGDGEFNTAFVEQVLVQAKNKAKQLLRKLAQPNFKTRGTYNYDNANTIGDLVNVKFGDSGWNPDVYPLRVQSVDYSFGKKGWEVSFKIEEDTDADTIEI